MSVEKQCMSCNKPLIGKRNHALTCGSTCRGIKFRTNKEPMVPVNLTFNITNYALVTKAAEATGKSINQYVHDTAVQSEYAQ
jgi:hypothetical protein